MVCGVAEFVEYGLECARIGLDWIWVEGRAGVGCWYYIMIMYVVNSLVL